MTPTTRTIELSTGLTIRVDEYGAASDGTGAVVLHGGAGPRSVAGFAAALSEHAYVIVPTHPGFDGTSRPDSTDTIEDLAVAYLDLIDALVAEATAEDVEKVSVVRVVLDKGTLRP